MRITQIGLSLVPSNGGVNKCVQQFYDAFEGGHIISCSNRHEISSDIEPDRNKIHWENSSIQPMKWYGYPNRLNRRKELEILSSTDLLISHVMLRYHAVWTMKVAKKFNIPYWLVPHGQLDPYVYTYRPFIKKLWLKMYGGKMMSGAAANIFATQKELEKSKWFYSGSNSKVIHWPVEQLDINRKESARDSIREKLGLPRDAFLLLYLGRIHSMKNPIKTIEAFAKVKNRNIHLLIVGPEGDISIKDCRNFIRDKKLENQVHVLGSVYGDEKNDLVLASDAYISMSHRENFNHTVAEALSGGVPVILSRGNDLAYDLLDVGCSILLDDNDIESATVAISKLVDLGKSKRHAMGMCGREYSSKNLSFLSFKSKINNLAESSIESFDKGRWG